MLLAVDVGNTNVTLALFDGERLVADWRVTSHRERTADEMAVELRQLFSLRSFEFDVVDGVVIDFGTAVTYDAINAQGDYLGGAIAPGVEISLNALVSHTAMLRRVEAVAPDSVIGRNTVTSIQSGLVWGFVAQVEGMVERMVAELGGSAKVIATGGQAALVAGLTHVIESIDPLLTLEGLRLIYVQNVDGSRNPDGRIDKA